MIYRKINYKMHGLYYKLLVYFYKYIICPFLFDNIYNKLSRYHIHSIEYTATKLANSNMSIGRFGDGELSWVFCKKSGIYNFEKPSYKLSHKLLNVLDSNDREFMIGLPDYFKYPEKFTSGSSSFWKLYIMRNYKRLFKILDKNKIYYNTSVTRPYIDYNYRSVSNTTFSILKRIWNNKKILIIEGKESRLGLHNDLFNNALNIKRIECPSINAFESYGAILKVSLNFLEHNSHYISLISLGPTATILAYDLFKHGYRAIDIGHVDLEYDWYLIGAKEKINLPYKYVNEVPDGHSALPVSDKKIDNQIIYSF